MPDEPRRDKTLALHDQQEINGICDRFEAAWKAGQRPTMETYLTNADLPRQELLRELLLVELTYRCRLNERPAATEYEQRFPYDAALIHAVFRKFRTSDTFLQDAVELNETDGHGGDGQHASPTAGDGSNPAGANADRNLLLGILALQLNFIDRKQLVNAFDHWTSDKSKPLGEILVELAALDIPQREMLDALVVEHVRKHGNDAEQSLAAISLIGPVRADLRQLADPDVEATLAHVSGPVVESRDTTCTWTAGTSTSAGTRFRVLRRHARGGLGEIYVAEDQELHREVALKEIQERHGDNPASRTRFILEAEVTGGLEHPSIVPVYGLGSYADGRPFYAMRFIKGDSLKDTIVRFHRANATGRNLTERTAELRNLLGRFIDVCNAIEYAHSRGVLHRDLKPGNIMLGNFGETLVVDWGLAKVMGRSETPASRNESALRPASGCGSAPTQMGQAVGTPQYMSPEQATGRWDELGPASDVYSLGATLYSLLTGRAPIGGGESRDALARAAKGEFPTPRTVDKDVPRALDAICLKAMALKPTDRYSSPRVLADDIERWLNDQPVSVYRDAFSRQMARWVRNHKVTTGAAVAAVVVLFVGGIIASAISRRANKLTQTVTRAQGLVESLVSADTPQVPEIVKQLGSHEEWARPLLKEKLAQAKAGTTQRLHLSLALVGSDEREVEYLYEQLLRADTARLAVIRDALANYQTRISDRLWKVLAGRENDPEQQRLRAAGALAKYDPGNSQWTEIAPEVVRQLVAINPTLVGQWQELLRPVAERLRPPLAEVFMDPDQSDLPRGLATSLLADYAKEDPEMLTNLVIDADTKAFGVLFPVLRSHAAAAIEKLRAVLDRTVEPSWSDPPLDATWTQPSVAARAAIESAHGVLMERFAFCQDLAWDEFPQAAEGLRPSGYRPTRVRPWRRDDKLLVAAVWTRDGKQWELETDHAREQLAQLDAPAEKGGLVPADVAVLPVTDLTDAAARRFVLLWGEPAAMGEERRLVVAASEQELIASQNTLAKQGFAAHIAIGVWTDSASERHYVGIWSNQGAPSELRAAYGGFELYDQPQWDVAAAPAARLADPLDALRQELADIAALPPAQMEQPQVRLIRARALYQLGQLDGALADLDFLVQKQVVSAQVLQYRAWTLARLGKVEEAQTELAKCLEQTNDPSTRACLQVVLVAWLGDYDEAATQLDAAATAGAEIPGALYNAACASALASQACSAFDAQRASNFRRRAIELLDTAVANGYQDVQRLRTDADLAALYGDSHFLALVDRLELPARYAAVCRADVEFESRLVEPTSPESQFEKARELAAQGYRPVSAAVFVDGSPTDPTVSSVWHRPHVPEMAIEVLAQRKATAAAALLRMGATERVWPLLTHQPDSRLRSYLLDRLVTYGVDPAEALAQLQTQSDVTRRRSLILAIGQYARAKLLSREQELRAANELAVCYEQDLDSGIHGAAEWSLAQLGARAEITRIRQMHATGIIVGERQWYLTREGAQTMVILRSGADFMMGSPVGQTDRFQGPTGKNEIRHRRRIGRTFAIGAHEVTVEQFQRFRRDHAFDRTRAREDDAPANNLAWYDAASFCNWLSAQEGIPRNLWCYDPDQPFADGMALAPDYLERTGYRLPTEAEWEYACRAGSTTARFFGETDRLLGEYAWYTKNSRDRWMLPVGSLKPNDWGLFDVYGNALERCQDEAAYFSTDRAWMEDKAQAGNVTDSQLRVLRGGSFISGAPNLRSANRYTDPPGYHGFTDGFRIARTCP